MKLKFAGIKRKEVYSPNHITNDSLILNKTSEVLRKMNYEVTVYDESFIETHPIEENFIFTMAQGKKGLQFLSKYEEQGKFIINRPSASLNSYRKPMIKLLSNAGIPLPESLVVDTGNYSHDIDNLPQSKLWLKRGDVHAEHKEDVTPVYSKEELYTLLIEFNKRGIAEAIIQEHISGDTIKFYGVAGTDFFYWYYLNITNNTPFDLKNLQRLSFESAEIIGLEIFGGDIIVSPDGRLTIIDINDFPSFAPIRDLAANKIGELINKKVLCYV